MSGSKKSVSIRKKWDDAVTVVFLSNDRYVFHIYTVINSIRMNNTSGRRYDFVILERDITERHKLSMGRKLSDKKTSIRFFNMDKFLDGKKLPTHGLITMETYFRYYITDIFQKYEKVLYLDVDVVVNSDLSELFDKDVSGKCVLATRDMGLTSQYYRNDYRKKYFDEILKLNVPDDYFQAGVMLFNIPELRNNIVIEDLIKLSSSRHWEYMDQDVLNIVLQGKVGFVEQNWDVTLNTKEEFVGVPEKIGNMYFKARENPKIIHYAGPNKPWDTDDIDFIDEYKKYLYSKRYRKATVKNDNAVTRFMRIAKNNGYKAAFYSTYLWAKNKIRK